MPLPGNPLQVIPEADDQYRECATTSGWRRRSAMVESVLAHRRRAGQRTVCPAPRRRLQSICLTDREAPETPRRRSTSRLLCSGSVVPIPRRSGGASRHRAIPGCFGHLATSLLHVRVSCRLASPPRLSSLSHGSLPPTHSPCAAAAQAALPPHPLLRSAPRQRPRHPPPPPLISSAV